MYICITDTVTLGEVGYCQYFGAHQAPGASEKSHDPSNTLDNINLAIQTLLDNHYCVPYLSIQKHGCLVPYLSV